MTTLHGELGGGGVVVPPDAIAIDALATATTPAKPVEQSDIAFFRTLRSVRVDVALGMVGLLSGWGERCLVRIDQTSARKLRAVAWIFGAR